MDWEAKRALTVASKGEPDAAAPVGFFRGGVIFRDLGDGFPATGAASASASPSWLSLVSPSPPPPKRVALRLLLGAGAPKRASERGDGEVILAFLASGSSLCAHMTCKPAGAAPLANSDVLHGRRRLGAIAMPCRCHGAKLVSRSVFAPPHRHL